MLLPDAAPEPAPTPAVETLRRLLSQSGEPLTRQEILARWPEPSPPRRRLAVASADARLCWALCYEAAPAPRRRRTVIALLLTSLRTNPVRASCLNQAYRPDGNVSAAPFGAELSSASPRAPLRCTGCGVPFRLHQRHRLETNGLQRCRHLPVDLMRRREFALLHLPENLALVIARKGWLADQQHVQRGAQAIDIAGRAQLVQPPVGLLGAHVARRADGAAHLCRVHIRAGRGLKRNLGINRVELCVRNQDFQRRAIAFCQSFLGHGT